MTDVNGQGFEMRPREGSTVIKLPVTIEGNKGRSDKLLAKVASAIGVAVIWVLVVYGLLTNSDFTLFRKILYVAVATVIAMAVARFGFLGEKKYRESYSRMEESKNEFDLSNMWAIVGVDEDAPHFVHYRNGELGLVVSMGNDVVVGKPENDEYNSYTALGDAYRRAAELELDMLHIDMMDFIGQDPRLDEARRYMSVNCTNPEIRDVMSSIFDNLQDGMNDNVTTQDIYVFHTRDMSKDVFRYNVRQVLDMMCLGNYATYRSMSQEEIGALVRSMFNLQSFSAVDAMLSAYRNETIPGIKVLSVDYADGSNKVWLKPYDERQAEEVEKRRRREERRNAAKHKGKKSKAGGVGDDDGLSLDDEGYGVPEGVDLGAPEAGYVPVGPVQEGGYAPVGANEGYAPTGMGPEAGYAPVGADSGYYPQPTYVAPSSQTEAGYSPQQGGMPQMQPSGVYGDSLEL